MKTKYKVIYCDNCKEMVELTSWLPVCPRCETLLLTPEQKRESELYHLAKSVHFLQQEVDQLTRPVHVKQSIVKKPRKPSLMASLMYFIVGSMVLTLAFSLSPVIGILALIYVVWKGVR